MTQTATVKRIVSSQRAEVVVRRASACGHECDDCSGCKMYDQPDVAVTAENLIGAKPGDTVVVESGTGRILGIAAVVYLVPFLLFFGIYFLAGALGASDPVSITLAAVGFLIGAALDLLLNRLMRMRRGGTYRIVSVERD